MIGRLGPEMVIGLSPKGSNRELSEPRDFAHSLSNRSEKDRGEGNGGAGEGIHYSQEGSADQGDPAASPPNHDAADSPPSASLMTPSNPALTSGDDHLVDAMLLPWQLVSQAGLSQLGQGSSPSMQQVVSARSDALAGGMRTACEFRSKAGDALGGAPSGRVSLVAGMQAAIEAQGREVLRKASEIEGARLLFGGARSAWPEKLVRWITGSDAQLTAWVRDYQAGEEEMQGLINELIEQAKSGGAPLARIVVNGHERWRANQIGNREED